MDIPSRAAGFSVVELVVVILIVAIVAAVALPRFVDVTDSARIATLESVAGTLRTTVMHAKAQARIDGLSVQASNPGNQSSLIVDFGFGATEVDWRNLCPESRGELGDALVMMDFLQTFMSGGLTAQFNNRYTLVGYDIPGFSVPTNQGCYVIYDSFGDPDCTVTVVTADC